MEDKFINITMRHESGGTSSARCYLMIDKDTGDGEVIVEKSISVRLPLSEIRDAEDIYKRLTDTTGGLKAFGIPDLLKAIGRGK
jgi:hypothetical protein